MATAPRTTFAAFPPTPMGQQALIEKTGLQPTKDAESAILASNLRPGGYTAILRGKNGGTGVGVVEVYVF